MTTSIIFLFASDKDLGHIAWCMCFCHVYEVSFSHDENENHN